MTRRTTWMARAAFTLCAAWIVAATAESSPRAIDKVKPAPMPAGRYILTSGTGSAAGDDVLELKKDFFLREGQYILSGGPSPTDQLKVDDDIEVLSGDRQVFLDDDGLATTQTRGKVAAKYHGFPIVLVADPTQKLRIKVKDCVASDAILGELWLHRVDGAKVKLTDCMHRASAGVLPVTFFDEQYDLLKVFDSPGRPRAVTGTVDTLPESPASLLPRFQRR